MIHQKYNNEVNPEFVDKKWINTRASEETRYEFYNKHKKVSLEAKEKHSIEIIKMALCKSKNPVISCSFGVDSIVTLFLVRKAMVELGRDPSDIYIAWNNTANEFPEVRNFQKSITSLWNLKLIVSSPKKTLKHVINENGGVTPDYFTSFKGDRKNNNTPLVEKCCYNLKHEPMYRMIKENSWDLIFNGIRADESNQRKISGLRDGEFYYSYSEWKTFMCRPLLWWLDDEIWDYVLYNDIPNNTLYDKNLIMKYPDKLVSVINKYKKELNKLCIDTKKLRRQEIQNVTRREATLLKKIGFKVFTPRTGCMMCPIPVKHGYLHWMRIYYPKVYNTMINNLGYGKALVDLLPNDVKIEIESYFSINLTTENISEKLNEILEYKPCTFDKLLK